MKLSYNPDSMHVKNDGAVIGKIEDSVGGWDYHHFATRQIEVSASTFNSLLLKVRTFLETGKAPYDEAENAEATRVEQLASAGVNIRDEQYEAAGFPPPKDRKKPAAKKKALVKGRKR